MTLSNSFGAATFTKADIEAVIAELDADPANKDKIKSFGITLTGQQPFPFEQFKAAKQEMLRRYDEAHIPSAESEAIVAQNPAARERAADMRASRKIFDERTDEILDMAAKIKADVEKSQREWREALADVERVAKRAFAEMNQYLRDTRIQIVKLEAQIARQGAQEMIAASDKARQIVRHIIEDQNRMIGVITQAGVLTEPVAAPKIAKFKPRKP